MLHAAVTGHRTVKEKPDISDRERERMEIMKRRTISLLLVAGMLGTMLAGCGGGGQDGAAGNKGASAATAGTESGAAGSAAEEGEPYTVGIQIVNVTTDQTDIEMVEEAVNEITVPAINCKVDIQNIFIGDIPTTTSMNVVSGDKMERDEKIRTLPESEERREYGWDEEEKTISTTSASGKVPGRDSRISDSCLRRAMRCLHVLRDTKSAFMRRRNTGRLSSPL